MKSFVTLLFLLFLGHSYSQNYVPFVKEGATWINVYWQSNEYQKPTIRVWKNFIEDDTVINNLNYKFIYRSSADSLNYKKYKISADLIREDTNRRIYVIYKDQGILDSIEYLLYDFNIEIGDTIYYNTPMNGDSLKYILKGIDTVQISGQNRRRYSFDRDLHTGTDYWYEGIGSIPYGFLGPHMEPFESGIFLGCYYDSIIYWRNNTGRNCSVLSVEENKYKKPSISAYPNPTQDKVHFNNLEPDITYRLYNTHGKLISKGDFISKNYIDLTSHPKGLFLVTLSYKEKRIANFKIIKQ